MNRLSPFFFSFLLMLIACKHHNAPLKHIDINKLKFTAPEEEIYAERKVAHVKDTFRRRKYLLDERWFNRQGKVIESRPGIAVCQYDVKRFKYNKQGLMVSYSEGEFAQCFLFNDWCNKVVYQGFFIPYLDYRSNKTLLKRGMLKAFIYNDAGVILKRYFLEGDDHMMSFTCVNNEYDKKGNLVKISYYPYQITKSSFPFLEKYTDKTGYSITTYQYRSDNTLASYKNVNDCNVCVKTQSVHTCDSTGLPVYFISKSEGSKQADTFEIIYTFRK